MTGVSGDELLRLPVRVRGIQLGRVVDVLLDPTEARALGVDVLCGDVEDRGEERRYRWTASSCRRGRRRAPATCDDR